MDVTGDAFKHGNLVFRGQRGVWVDIPTLIRDGRKPQSRQEP